MSRKVTLEEFIDRANKVHDNKYDYSKVDYVDLKTKVCIICPIHGEFYQLPIVHIKGSGCKFCSIENKKWSKEKYIEAVNKVHENEYDYSEVEYNNMFTKICIICHKKDKNGVEHGRFYQTADSHLRGHKCPKCANEQNGNRCRKTKEKFIEDAINVHGEKYDYSKVEYVNNRTPTCIVCHMKDENGNEHGEFYQTPDNHLKGKGCSKCRFSHLERLCMNLLEQNNIEYMHQKKFKWLGRMSLDFYLPKQNIGIECQGLQHFIENGHGFLTDKELSKIKERDTLKKKLCEENNVTILYYSNLHIDYPYKVFEDNEELLNEIKKYSS